MKKSILYTLAGIIIFAAGAAAGAYGEYYFRFSNPEITVTQTATSTVPQVSDYQIPQDEINKITALEPGNVLGGKVTNKDDNGITISFWLYNAINPDANKSVPVQIPFNPSVDKVMRLALTKGETTQVPASYADIKVGTDISVYILSDHKECQ